MSRTVRIGDKDYVKVGHRLMDFRKDHPLYGIQTELLGDQLFKATITDADGRVIAQAHGHKTGNAADDFEKAETKAVGRALAFLGYGGEEIASAEDMQDWERRQAPAEPDPEQQQKEINKLVLEGTEQLKGLLPADTYDLAIKAIDEEVGAYKTLDLAGRDKWLAALNQAVDNAKAAADQAKVEREIDL
jgi:hypothetical protein